ncbi:MAG: AMP-binding protein [Bifidobacteriaceae bacterium]|nr:AMP-binding protein [Bifidobacteriaceae bacterium]
MAFLPSINKHLSTAARKAAGLLNELEDNLDEASRPRVKKTTEQPSLPSTVEWSEGYPTETFIDPQSHLMTTRTRGNGEIPDSLNIYGLYAERAERMGEDPLYYFKQDGQWVSRTANETLADIRATAKGLMHYGLKKGDGVAFMCHTSYEWNVIDAAVMACGGVLATVYDTDSAEQIRNIVNNSDARFLIVETLGMKEKADGAIEDCESLESISCLENGALSEIQAYGETISDAQLDERIDSVKKTDLCSIVYTSGSTAAPKGVEMTHEHYCTMAMNLRAYIPDLLFDTDGSVLMFLPQAHSFARAINYAVVAGSIRVYIAGSIATLISDLQVARPTVMIGVPRVFEKVYNASSQKAGHGAKGRVFALAVRAARQYMKELSEKGKVSKHTAALRATYDPIVYSQLRAALGGRAKWIVSGGAPLDPALLSFFRGARVPVYEGYGLTETTAPCAFAPLGTPFHQGSIGIAFPGFDLRISTDGEIQIKGASTFHRYHKNDEATSESFTPDGWYASGDLGRIDPDGFVYITGRKKDIIITAGGKNVAPGPIEAAIQRCSIVSNAVVLGDKRPFISALVTLDSETLGDWLSSKGLDENMSVLEASSNAAVHAEIQKYVDLANEGVSRAESVRKFIVLPEDFTQDNGLLTASMKVIRPKVLKHYAQLLDTQMYTPRKK